MINIKDTSKEFNKVEKYLLTIAPSIKSMKDVPDQTSLVVAGWLLFDDVDEETGATSEILSIITPEKEVYALQSATFKRSLMDIAGIMDGEEFSIIKVSGKTKAGRDYINCLLDVSRIK